MMDEIDVPFLAVENYICQSWLKPWEENDLSCKCLPHKSFWEQMKHDKKRNLSNVLLSPLQMNSLEVS